MPERRTAREAAAHPTPVSDSDGPAGLYDDFEAYRTATDADYQRLLTSGLVIPDTNVFLNLYRYDVPTRDDPRQNPGQARFAPVGSPSGDCRILAQPRDDTEGPSGYDP
jgi:hypothetical protein